MAKIKVLEAFSGIGAQAKAITNLQKEGIFDFKIVGTIDWDVRAIISYAAIHNNLWKEYKETLKNNKLDSEEQIDKFLNNFNLSLNGKTKSFILRKDYFFKQILAAAILLSKNLGDITSVDVQKINKLKPDLITYSFPCQGLSIANMGRAKGIMNEESTSSLVWNIYKILESLKHKPKYLLMENVRNLLSNKFIDQYKLWLKNLENMGYQTYTTTINALNCGSIQKRERVFAISIYKPDRYFLNDDLDFSEHISELCNLDKLDFAKRKEKFNEIFNFRLNNEENTNALINNTPSRIRLVNESKIINNSKDFIINTVTTKQDRIPCCGVVEHDNDKKNKLKHRFLTPREAFMLMGFESTDFDKLLPFIEKNILTKEALYRQAGNSIVVQVIKKIFKLINNKEKKWTKQLKNEKKYLKN